ncbi:MAG: transglutaminase domain-containing protein [Ignavibacteriaceae bacterium]|nr:transglutaminase domain-containing protein [Ignavibacteriaceae bacterium]
MIKKTFFNLLLFTIIISSQTKYPEINEQVEKGNFTQAQTLIEGKLFQKTISETEKYDLQFQIELMDRIRKDFRKTRDEVVAALKKNYPVLTDEMMDNWEKDKSLEMILIDGEKKYFNNAVANLFRINKDARELKRKNEGNKLDDLDTFLEIYIPKVAEASNNGERYVLPVKMKIKYSLSVKPNVVPDGEIIRCWLPYPKESDLRQSDVKLISTNRDDYIIADDKNLQRTIYMEGKTEKDKPTVFNFELEYVSKAEYVNLFDGSKKITFDQNKETVEEYTKEEFPHIVFSDRIKTLSKQIVGDEKDPIQKLKRIFTWVDENIPWASAREYSTIENIPEYALENKHGDCGIQSLTFMTFCRYNGIPAKWQSGWMMHPPEVNLHDWCEIYVDDYGWIPVDQSFGIKSYLDESHRYFYLGGIDAYRFIVNDGYSKPLFPAKIFPRSETVDFQRGEVEWRGGNLYFDKWNYSMEVEYLE